MTRKRNPSLPSPQKNDSDNENKIGSIENVPQTIEGNGLLEIGNNKIINARIVEILVSKEEDATIELNKLLDAEIEYNRRRFEIIRDHSEKNPDSKEDRCTKKFRRTQYAILLAILVPIIGAIPFISIAAAFIFGTLAMLIVSGVLLNGRERELDISALTSIINAILRRKS